MTLADCVQTISPTAPVSCRSCADCTSQPEASQMQGQTPHLPHWIWWVMAKKGNQTLPNLGIMLVSKEVRDGRATDTEIVGRPGNCTEQEEEPRGLQVLHSWNAVEQQPVGINRQLELHPDEFTRTRMGPRTRMPLSSGRSSKSPNQSFASGSAMRATSSSAAWPGGSNPPRFQICVLPAWI